MKLYFERYVPGMTVWLANRLTLGASALYRERFGISTTDWRVLAHFEIFRWFTASHAAEQMGLDKAIVSRSVNALKEGGWLKARPLGLRKVEYSLTALGKKLHDHVAALSHDREEALLSGFTSEQRERLLRDLQRLVENIERVDRIGR